MSNKTKDQIKAFFITGAKPNQSQFVDFIDSYVDKSGPLGVLETAVSGGGSGFIYASAADAKIIGAAAALANLGATVVTTAQSSAVINGFIATTAAAVAGTDSSSIMTPQLVNQVASSKMVLLATASASASSTLDFTSAISSSYSSYIFVFSDLLSSTSANIQMKASINNGSTWTTTFYSQLEEIPVGTNTQPSYTNVSDVTPVTLSSANSISHWNGRLEIFISSGAGIDGSGFISWGPNGGVCNRVSIVAGTTANTGINAIRFQPSAGNFTSGKIYMYGIKNT